MPDRSGPPLFFTMDVNEGRKALSVYPVPPDFYKC